MQWALVATLAVGMVAGFHGVRTLMAQQEPVKRQVLEKVDLGDKDRVMYVAEIAPGASTGKHFHPGPEAVYVLQGAGTLEMEAIRRRPSRPASPSPSRPSTFTTFTRPRTPAPPIIGSSWSSWLVRRGSPLRRR
jgi:Cupin domain